MKFLKNAGITRKLVWMMLLSTSLALLLAAALSMSLDYLLYRKEVLQDLATAANIIGGTSTAALLFEDQSTGREVLSALKANVHISQACVYDKEGRLFTTYRSGAEGSHHPFPDPEPFEDRISGNYAEIFRPVLLDNEQVGMVYIRGDIGEIWLRLYSHAAILALVILIAFLASAMFSFKLQRVISLPIVRLSRLARRVTENQDFSVRETRTSEDELGSLVDSFNEMLAEIQTRDDALRKAHEELEYRVLERTRALQDEITERERSEAREHELNARLSRAERMESLGILAGGVAHDLNNILGPIVGYPDLMLNELPDDDPMRRDLLEVKSSAKQAAAVIQDLLTLSRRGSYRMRPLDVNEVVENFIASATFRERVKVNPLTRVNLKLGDDLLPVMGSTHHLGQVVMNLITNAFEAMPKGGGLTVETKMQYVDSPIGSFETVEEGDYVVLNVRDSGEGIAPEHLERIFEPFYTNKNLGRSGTGLGLAVVYGVIRDHEGYIDVETQVGRGTVFSIYLPVTREAVQEEDENIENLRGTESILVVDDVEQQRELAARMLKHLGYTVHTAGTANEAILFLQDQAVDLLVLDMIMGDEVDALDIYRRTLEFRPGLPCIIASGYSETDRVREAIAIGVGDYLKKPYTVDNLGRSVRRELDRHRQKASART